MVSHDVKGECDRQFIHKRDPVALLYHLRPSKWNIAREETHIFVLSQNICFLFSTFHKYIKHAWLYAVYQIKKLKTDPFWRAFKKIFYQKTTTFLPFPLWLNSIITDLICQKLKLFTRLIAKVPCWHFRHHRLCRSVGLESRLAPQGL